ncbi:MAG: cation:proton antiporter, partial [Cyanophyceae cyanobacterium]
MIEITPTLAIAWVAFPFFIGFTVYLLPQLDRYFALAVTLASLGFSSLVFLQESSQTFELLDSFGVTLIVDTLGGFFILT